MTRDEAIAAAKAQGFRRIRTYGGWVELDAWTPYGQAGGRARFRLEGDSFLEESTRPEGFVRGIWELSA